MVTILTENGESVLSDLINLWLKHLEQRYSNATVSLYNFVLNEFLLTLPPGLSKTQITPLHIENYINNLIKTNHKNITCNRYLAAIRSFFHWAQDNYNVENPTKHIKDLIEIPSDVRCLTEEEYHKIISITTGLENAALQFLGNTGLRRNEFRFLQWKDFTPDFIRVLGKGSKQRYVPLNKTCKNLIEKYSQNGEDQPAFVSAFEYRESLYLLGQRLARKLDIPPFGPHALRHYFATTLIRKGVSLIKVSKLLGHSSVTITEKIYVHLVPMDFSGLTDCLDI
jgi:site-specific recombinase XerD